MKRGEIHWGNEGTRAIRWLPGGYDLSQEILVRSTSLITFKVFERYPELISNQFDVNISVMIIYFNATMLIFGFSIKFRFISFQ